MAAEPIDNDPTGADQAKRIIVDDLQTVLNVARMASDNMQRQFWESPYGLTPQEVCDAENKKASALWDCMVMTRKFVADLRPKLKNGGAAPLNLKPAGATVTQNEDGTVTITGV